MATKVESFNVDDLIRNLGGCTTFQVVVTVFTTLVNISCAFSTIVMSFGIYNPGWRCLDGLVANDTQAYDDARSFEDAHVNQTSGEHERFTDTCIGFESCQHVQFNPEESTIVTEWALICGDSWKASAIISIQMAGMTIGHFMGGYLGDTHGRKLTMAVCILIHAALGFFSVASVTWEMFAVLKFLIGVVCGVIFCLTNVYAAEFVTPKWRAIVPSLPMWVIGCSILSLCALVFKDWRQLHIFNGVFATLLLIPAYLLPESLRWLIIKNKEKKSYQAVAHMAKLNRADVSAGEMLNKVTDSKESGKVQTTNGFTFTRLFHKNTRKLTLIFSLTLFQSNIVYFSSSFGVASLPGDIYINNIIIYLTDFPGNIIAWFAPNIFGRRPTGMMSCLGQAVSILAFLAFDIFAKGTTMEIGVLLFIISARICSGVMWYVVLTCVNELYPAVIRSAAAGLALFVSGVAAILSPYLIISVSVMRFSYLANAICVLVCCGLFVYIPETSGTDLSDDVLESSGHDDDIVEGQGHHEINPQRV